VTASNRTSGDDAAGSRDVLQSARPLSACGTAALEYAARGWEVFPAPPGEKKSHKSAKHSGGVKWGKTVNPKIIGDDFRKWSNANVAIVTGAASGIFVIEADTPKGHGVDGLASIKALEAEHGSLPETLIAVSPSGSIHRYYRHPGADIYIKNSTSAIAPGVDVRGDGGMVIAPPSIKPGAGEYRWLNDLPIADAPDWLLTRVIADTKGKKKSPRARMDEQVQANNGTFEPNSEPASPYNGLDFNLAKRQGKSNRMVADLDEIEAALMVIPNDASVNWGSWNRIGMAVFSATGGSAAGFAMFDKWSQKYPGYDSEHTAAKWEWLEKCLPTEIGVGTLFYEADQASPTWRADHRLSLLRADAIRADKPEDPDLVKQAIEIFDTAQPLRCTLAEEYLTGLGLTVPDVAHEALRFHPQCPLGEHRLPCLVAYVQDSLTNEPAGVHLTALSADAIAIGLTGAMESRTIGAIDSYCAIKLGGAPDASGELTIASNIEAALRAMAFDFKAAWSVLSVSGIAEFPKPRFHNIKRLTVIVDTDEAVDAAEQCKARWGNVVRLARSKA
jgi:hypothetical protein